MRPGPATCWRRRSIWPSKGGPGPVHIHVPENLTHHGISVDNYRDIDLRVKPMLPDPARVAEVADVLVDALSKGQQRAGADRLRGSPQQCRTGTASAARALPDPLRDHARRQGHHFRASSAVGRGILRQRPQGCARSFPGRRRDPGGRQFASPSTRPSAFATICSRTGSSSTSTSTSARSTRSTRPTPPSSPTPSRRSPRCSRRCRACSTRSRSGRSSGHDYSQERIIHLIGKIHPGQMAQALSRQLPDNAIVLADAGAHLAWLGYYLELSAGRGSASRVALGRWPAA